MAKQRIGTEKGRLLASKAGLNTDDVVSVWGRGDRRQVEIYTRNGGFYTLKRSGEVKCVRAPLPEDGKTFAVVS